MVAVEGAGDSQSAGVQCVYTLSVVTVVGLGLVSEEVWERTKHMVMVMFVRMWKRDSEKRGTEDRPHYSSSYSRAPD